MYSSNSSFQSMYAQPGGSVAGGGGGSGNQQWGAVSDNNQSFPPPNQYAMNGYAQGQPNQDAGSSANLFHQQLAQQMQSSPPNQPQPPLAAANSYQSSAQAYMQSQQQLAHARQAQAPPANRSSFPTSSQSPASSSSHLPLGYPPSNQQPPPAQHHQQQQQQSQPPQLKMTGPEVVSHLRGINLQAMTPQIFSTLTPIQQQAFREFLVRSRMHQAQQQAQLGLGLPSSPATPVAQNSLPPNQVASTASPAPVHFNKPRLPQTQQTNATSASQIGFLRVLGDFCTKKGIPFSTAPVVEGRTLELPKLYAAVNGTGGFVNTNARRAWGVVATALEFPAPSPSEHPEERTQKIAAAYHSVLYPFEQHVAQIQLQRIQAARAAAAGQAQSTSVMNGTPSASIGALNPHQPSPSHPSPLATQANLPSHPVAASTPPVISQSPRPSSSASVSASNADFNLSQNQFDPNSKIAPSLEARPKTGSSRRESIVQEDIKGKGRATGEALSGGPIKAEDFAVNGTHTPKTSTSLLPESGNPASPHRPRTANASKSLVTPLPEQSPAQPPRRKRQKIEYVPYNKTLDTVAGYDLAGVEEVLSQTVRRKRPRTAYDLGLVDLHSLTMSLRSRLASEVSFALDSLTLISISIRTHPQEPHAIHFPLSRCRDLYEELIDLLEETAFGHDDDREEKNDVEPAPETYSDLFQVITEQAGQLEPPDPHERNRIARLADSGYTPLQPADILLSVTNILRNFSITEENAELMGKDAQFVQVLARLTKLPLKPNEPLKKEEEDGEEVSARWPTRLSPLDSMAVKKDVLEMVVNFGLQIRLEETEPSTARDLFELFSFFLLDADRQGHTYFDLSQTPGAASRLAQPAAVRIPHYLGLALAAFSQVALVDSNRTIISRSTSISTLERLFESLIRLVPISESDFQILTHESGLIYVENLVMSLYNLAFLSPPELKLKLRKNPAYVKSLMRVVRRLSGTGSADVAAQAFQALIERCISILHLLNTLEGVTVGSGGMESSQIPWWGMSMSGFEEEEEAAGGGGGGGQPPLLRPAQPKETDRGTVKQRAPPTASTASGLDPGLPILSGETKALFESLDNKSMVNVFASLVALL